MKKFILFLLICFLFCSCTNTVTNIESSDLTSEISSEEIVSSTVTVTKNLSDIADTIAEKLSLRDSVLADAKVLEGMTGITPEMYVEFSGKVSYALDNFDTVMVFYTSNEEDAEKIEQLLSETKEKYIQLYVEELKTELENSVIYSQDGYIFWVVAKDTTSVIEIISELL